MTSESVMLRCEVRPYGYEAHVRIHVDRMLVVGDESGPSQHRDRHREAR